MINHSVYCGVDVAKAELVIARSDQSEPCTIKNSPTAIATWLKRLPAGSRLLIEATGSYHLALAFAAHARGHRVYIVDGYKLSQYRKGIGARAKTDLCDAALLLRYLHHEIEQLRLWTPPPDNVTKISALLRRRAQLIKHRGATELSLREVPEINAKQATRSLTEAIAQIEELIRAQLKDTPLDTQVNRCREAYGIGFLSATALTIAYNKGQFTRADAFVAFLGMDVIARDSGTYRGKRKLSKKGDVETRRLLYNAASSAARHGACKAYYEQHLARGKQRTQVLIMIARKLIRIAFCLLKNNSSYNPDQAFKLQEKCA